MSVALRQAWKEEKEMAKIEKRLCDSVIVKLGQHESKNPRLAITQSEKASSKSLKKKTKKADYIRFVAGKKTCGC